MSSIDHETVRAAAEIRRRIAGFIRQAKRERYRPPLAWFLERSPLVAFWIFTPSVWLARISFDCLYDEWEFYVARVPRDGAGLIWQTREVIPARELYQMPPAVRLHPFESAIDRCLDRFRNPADLDEARRMFSAAALGVPWSPSELRSPADEFLPPPVRVFLEPGLPLPESANSVAAAPASKATANRPLGVAIEDSRAVPVTDLREVHVMLVSPSAIPPTKSPPDEPPPEEPKRINFREFL